MIAETNRHRFSVEDYHRMGEVGILRGDERVELIDGEIVRMTPIGSAHAACVKRLLRRLVSAAGERAIVSAQDPIVLGPASEPQPDLALLRPRADFYAGAHPGPDDVWLIVEVAETSLAFDRAVKVPLYARAGIAEVWLIDLPGQHIEVYRQPSEGRYAQVHRLPRGQRVTPHALPDLGVAVDEVLG
jgi:Uma2 family endonuclease